MGWRVPARQEGGLAVPSHRGCGGFCPAEVINVFLGYVKLPAPLRGRRRGRVLLQGGL